MRGAGEEDLGQRGGAGVCSGFGMCSTSTSSFVCVTDRPSERETQLEIMGLPIPEWFDSTQTRKVMGGAACDLRPWKEGTAL